MSNLFHGLTWRLIAIFLFSSAIWFLRLFERFRFCCLRLFVTVLLNIIQRGSKIAVDSSIVLISRNISLRASAEFFTNKISTGWIAIVFLRDAKLHFLLLIELWGFDSFSLPVFTFMIFADNIANSKFVWRLTCVQEIPTYCASIFFE